MGELNENKRNTFLVLNLDDLQKLNGKERDVAVAMAFMACRSVEADNLKGGRKRERERERNAKKY